MEKSDKKSLDWQLLRRVVRLATPYKSLLIWSLFLAIILAPISTMSPYIVKMIVDQNILPGNMSGIWWLIGLYVALLMLNVVFRYQFIYGTARLGQSVIRDLRVRVFKHITGLKLRYFDQNPIGTSTTRTISDIEAINEIFTQGVITIIADILTVVAVLAIMFYTSWQLAIICVITLPFMVLATYVFKEKVKVSFQNVRKEISNLNAFMQERISGMRTIKIFNAQQKEREKFKQINHRYTDANLKAVLYYAVFFPVVELISAIGLALMVWLGAKAYLQDYVTFGALVAFPMFLDMLFRPVRMLADKFNTLQMGLVASERVFKVLDDNSVIANDGKIEVAKLKGDIRFDKVDFAYDGENLVLKNISFEARPGDTIALVGSTGSGKTSIVNVLNRFYEIQSGEISIDGNNIRDYEMFSLRRRMAMVLQDVFLFTGTLYENITLNDSSISLEKVINAAKTIGAHSFFEVLPGGYDYVIMERGNNLSHGQRQLISFVRAMVFDPDILILDEATSSIDVETEGIIQNAIEKLIKRRTSIVIAHRLSTIQHADQILVMKKGKIIERGRHDDLLLNDDGYYRELYEMQFKEGVEV